MCTYVGASSGIGAATAIHFAKIGYRLAICGRNIVRLNEVAESCSEANANLVKDDVMFVANFKYKCFS